MRYSMAVLKVKDAEVWKRHFHREESRQARRAAGEKKWQLFFIADDPNSFVLLNEWEDEGRAMKFLQSDTLRGFQEAAGVVGTPQVFLFSEAQEGST